MIVKIRRGIGNPGKLWTGSVPEDGEVVNARIIERKCSCCDRTTRRLRTQPVENAEAIAVACEIPTVFVTMGGVGSVATLFYPEKATEPEVTPEEFRLWNWSHRVGGHVVLNPVAVLNGYWAPGDLPTPRAGHYWIQTYSGSTLSEFVLLHAKEGEQEDEGSEHSLQIVSLTGKCPPCRHQAEIEATPETLGVTLAEFVSVGGTPQHFEGVLGEMGLPAEDQVFCTSVELVMARGLVRLAQAEYSPNAELYRAAVAVAKQRAAEEPAS